MSKYCPDWLFSAVAALVAQRYLHAPFELAVFARKYAAALSEHYADVPAEHLEQTASEFLRILAEVEADDADGALRSFACDRLTRLPTGENRRIKGLFSSALDGTRNCEYSPAATIKAFRPFYFMMRTKPALAAPASWTWKQVQDGDWINSLPEIEVSILDNF